MRSRRSRGGTSIVYRYNQGSQHDETLILSDRRTPSLASLPSTRKHFRRSHRRASDPGSQPNALRSGGTVLCAHPAKRGGPAMGPRVSHFDVVTVRQGRKRHPRQEELGLYCTTSRRHGPYRLAWHWIRQARGHPRQAVFLYDVGQNGHLMKPTPLASHGPSSPQQTERTIPPNPWPKRFHKRPK